MVEGIIRIPEISRVTQSGEIQLKRGATASVIPEKLVKESRK